MDIHRHVLCHSWLLASPVCHWDKMRRATLPNHSTSSSRVTYQLWHAEWEFLWLQVEHGFTCTDELAFTNSIVLVQYNLQWRLLFCLYLLQSGEHLHLLGSVSFSPNKTFHHLPPSGEASCRIACCTAWCTCSNVRSCSGQICSFANLKQRMKGHASGPSIILQHL